MREQRDIRPNLLYSSYLKGLAADSSISRPKRPPQKRSSQLKKKKKRVIYSQQSVLLLLYLFFIHWNFFILQRNTVMVPSPRMCALCVYQIPLVFTRHLAFSEKTFSNNAFCYETSFLSCTHTTVCVTSVHFQPSAVTVEGKTHLWTVISEGWKYNWLLSTAAYSYFFNFFFVHV